MEKRNLGGKVIVLTLLGIRCLRWRAEDLGILIISNLDLFA